MKQRSLQTQLGAIFLGFLLLVISAVAATFWLTQTQQHDAAIINLAGRQRMLAQQMARLALTDAESPELAASRDRFAQTLTGLAEGGVVEVENGRFLTLLPTRDAAAGARLEEAVLAWSTFQTHLLPPVDNLALQSELAALLDRLDALTGAYEALAEAKIARLRLMQVIFLAAAGLLLAWGYRFVHHRLIQPLGVLAAASQEIGAGNLGRPVPALPDDELGQLAQAMERMRAEIAAAQGLLEQRVARRTQELTAAFEFSQEIVRQLEPEQLLQSVTERARELMQGQTASICVLDGNGRFLELVANSGANASYLGMRQPVTRDLTLPVVQDQQTVVTEGGCANCGFLHHFPGAACIATPLQIGGQSLGALCVARPQRPFDEAEIRALTLLANAAAIALENSRLIAASRQQAKENAALAERERLAAELHDNLAQTLGALHLGADQLAGDLSAGTIPPAQNRLAEIQHNLKQAYAQVRMALTGLREPPPDDGELMVALRETLAEFEAQTSLPVELVGEVAPGWLTAVVQKQALHIVREALTNVRRHAQATQVKVIVNRESDSVSFQISDNGVGFNPDKVSGEHHLGLTIMQARAERSQGCLDVRSAPGHGAQITATFPVTSVQKPELENT